ncbi:MAG: hypothetical protein EOP45_05240 [Sphingobacteriaceae bacterium]|nr:MAG: hypothetical protein EOP45_05240 [Sphingobacteriaceae bacterium]
MPIQLVKPFGQDSVVLKHVNVYNNMKKHIFVILVLTGLLTTDTTQAQDFIFNPTLDPTAAIGYAAGEILKADIAKKAGISSSTGTNRPTAAASLTYKSTPALRQQTVTTLAKRLQPNNSAGAKAVTDNFGPGKTDYGQQYQAMIKSMGLYDNNAADALTNYLITGYQIVNNLTGDHDISTAQNLGARAQVATLLASKPSLKTPANCAQLGEQFKLQTVLLGSGWVGSVKANTQVTYQKDVAAMFKRQYHMDMAQLKLTAQGFAKK